MNIENIKVAALIVTFNRKNMLAQCLHFMQNQTRLPDKIFIYDNASTDGTCDMLLSMNLDKTRYEVLQSDYNLGGAGGFSNGMRYIFAKDTYDFIWLMDDDAFVAHDALEGLLKYYTQLPEKKQRNVGVLVNEIITDRAKFDVLNDQSNRILKKSFVANAMFVGYMVSTTAIEDCGFPPRETFIYSDDLSFTMRIRGKFSVNKVKGSYIYHQDWLASSKKKRLGPIAVSDVPYWKMYYIIRNGPYLFRKDPFILVCTLIYELLFIIFPHCLVDKNYWKYTKIAWKHAFNHVSGVGILPGAIDFQPEKSAEINTKFKGSLNRLKSIL